MYLRKSKPKKISDLDTDPKIDKITVILNTNNKYHVLQYDIG